MQSYRNIHSVSHRDDPEALLERLPFRDSLAFLNGEGVAGKAFDHRLLDDYKLYNNIYNSKTVKSWSLEGTV